MPARTFTAFACLSTAVLAAFACFGCNDSSSPSTPAATTSSVPEVDPRAVLADAPENFGEFVAWAQKAVTQRPDPVAVPTSPTLPDAKWPVIRLSDPAKVKRAAPPSSSSSKPQQAVALAEIGPFSSDQPNTNTFAAQRVASPDDGRPVLQLTMGGFSVERERVGMVEIILTVPEGDHIRVQWTRRAGYLNVNTPEHEKVTRLPIATEGLAEWEGPLDSISIQTDGVPSRPVVVERIRFWSRANAYPEAVAVKRARLERTICDSVYAHCPATITYKNIKVPVDAMFRASLGVVADRKAAAGAADTRFELLVESDGEQTSVLDQLVPPKDAWTDVSASLAKWAGKPVSVILRTTNENTEAVALWGNPTIYQPVKDPPFVIVYLIDALASEHINLYGYQRETMPNLTAIAQQGAWFPEMVSNSSRTMESIPDLMLSMTSERHGVRNDLTVVPFGLVTMAEVAEAAGFATASFVTNVYAGPRARMDQGFATFVDKIGYHWSENPELADRTVPLKETLHWIDTHRDRPMLMYVHTAEPHAPYTPPPGFDGKFDAAYTGKIDGTYDRSRGFRTIRNPRQQQRDWQHVLAIYDEEINYADSQLGKFVDGIDQLGLHDRANLFVIADHGEEFLQHGGWEHGINLHNEETYIPFVCHGPLVTTRGPVDVPAQIVDVMPTVLGLLGLPEPYSLLGHNLAPLLHASSAPAQVASLGGGESAGPPEALLAQYRERTVFGSNYNWQPRFDVVEYYAFEDLRWKLLLQAVRGASGYEPRFRLYDVKADRRERKDVINEQPEVARRLIEKLLVWLASQHPYSADLVDIVTPDDLRQKEAMGYVGSNTSLDQAADGKDAEHEDGDTP